MASSNRFFQEYEKLRDSNLLFESILIYGDRNTYESSISFLVFRFLSGPFCNFVLRHFIKGINKWYEGSSYEVKFYFKDELKLESYFKYQLKYDPFGYDGPYREDSYSLEAILTNSCKMEEKIIKSIVDRYAEQKS